MADIVASRFGVTVTLLMFVVVLIGATANVVSGLKLSLDQPYSAIGSQADAALMLQNSPDASGPVIGILAILASLFGAISHILLRREVVARQTSSKAEKHAQYLVSHDSATGLPNASHFKQALSEVEGQATLILLDLANFAQTNDMQGRAFGDVVIREIAWRLDQLAKGQSGIAARMGGDRFALLVPFEGRPAIENICDQVVEICGQPVSMGARTINPSIRLGGVALSQLKQDGRLDFDAILRVASFVLSACKTDGTARYKIYDQALEERFESSMSLAEALPKAIHDGLLEVHLQPRVSLDCGQVLGFEALVRWCRDGAFVPACQIITAAEETGFIVELDHYMLDHAVEVIADWNRRRKTKFQISVNLSAAHFRDPNGADFVLETLKRRGFPAELLILEIADTVRFENNAFMIRALAKLRAAGCRISIDDFGTGFSSISSLRALNADEIKIDPSLVADLGDSAEAKLILDSVLRIARKLRMDIIVEGVEHSDQADMLRKLGCETAQGYHFGRPRPAADWLADATYGPGGAAA